MAFLGRDKSSYWSVINNFVTEFKIVELPVSLQFYVESSIASLYDRAVTGCFNNILNVDERIKRTFSTNTAVPNHTFGLKDLITRSIITNSEEFYKVELVDGYVRYSKVQKNLQNSNMEDILVIKGSSYRAKILEIYYATIYRYLNMANTALHLQNKPVIKIPQFQSDNRSTDDSTILGQITSMFNMLKKDTGFGVVDEKASIEILNLNVSMFEKVVEAQYGLISERTGYPVSWIKGSTTGALNMTGDGDRQQLEEQHFNMYTDFIENILKRVYAIVGVEFGVVYHEYTKHVLSETAKILASLDRISFIEDSRKKEIANDLLEVVSKQKKGDKK